MLSGSLSFLRCVNSLSMDLKYASFAVVAVLGGVLYSNSAAVERALMQAFSQSTAAQRLAVLYTQGVLSQRSDVRTQQLQRVVHSTAFQPMMERKVHMLDLYPLRVPCSSIQPTDALSRSRVSNAHAYVCSQSPCHVSHACRK
jgi:hypothetical protein